MMRLKQLAAHSLVVLQGIKNGLPRSKICIRATFFSLHFFLLLPKLLPYKVTIHLRKQFFKRQGMQLIKQIETNRPESLPTTRIRVYYVKELLDYLLELNQENLVEHISSTRLAKTIDALFDAGLSVNAMIRYIDNYKYKYRKK